jgi:hypothetical protein
MAILQILTLCPVETKTPPPKAHQPGQLSYRILYDVLLVEVRGIEPLSRTLFCHLQRILYLYSITNYDSCQCISANLPNTSL